MEGETRQHWYPLMGRQANANDNQGDILIVMSFIVSMTPISRIEYSLPSSRKKQIRLFLILLIQCVSIYCLVLLPTGLFLKYIFPYIVDRYFFLVCPSCKSTSGC